MNDSDGLFIDDVQVASGEGIACTFQNNDLTKPTTLQSSGTNTFHLPDSLAVRRLTQNAQELDSASRYAYQVLTAKYINRGQIVFSGFAELEHFSAGWDTTLYEEKLNLFDRLGRSIRTADLSRYNHVWSIPTMNRLSLATDGVCYPLIDYGLLSAEVIPGDTLFPAVFVHTLLAQLLLEEGYTLVGDLPSDELYKRLVIPFTESEPTDQDETWRDDRKARVTMQAVESKVDRGTLGSKLFLDRIQTYNLDNLPDQGFEQGKLHNYSTQAYTYTCDTPMRLRVQGFQAFKAMVVTGAVEVVLSITVNGNAVDNARFEASTGYNLLFTAVANVTLDKTISCQKGDRVQIRLLAQRQTQTGAFRMTVYNDPDTSWVSFTPDLVTHTGDIWKVAPNLPDVSGLNLLKALAYLFCGTWSVDARRRQISFVSLDKILSRVNEAVDWSSRVDTGTEPGYTPRIDPYAQSNLLRWKEVDETKKAGKLVGDISLNYSDGIIPVDAPVLDSQVDLFEMPFAASTDSNQSLGGYGNPVLIKTRSTSGFGSSLTISKQSTAPRLLLVTTINNAQSVRTNRLAANGLTVEETTVDLRPAWFGVRPNRAIAEGTAFSLCFEPLPLARGEQCLIDRHYTGLKRVLRRMRVLDVSMRLLPRDIAQLDFGRPVRLQGVRIGSLTISDSLWYLNKISDYVDGQTCQVTLIGF